MEQNLVQYLKTSLQSIADSLSEKSTPQTLYQSILSLMKPLDTVEPPVSAMTESDIQYRIRFYNSICTRMNKLAEQIAQRPASAKAQQQMDELRTLVNTLGSDLSGASAELQELQTRRDELTQQLANLRSEVLVAEQRVTTLQSDFEQQQLVNQSLHEKAAAYSVSRTTALQEENRELAQQVSEAERIFNDLQNTHKRLQERLAEQEAANAALQHEIDSQPPVLIFLVDKHAELAQRLERLKNAEVECSAEKQQELQNEIDQLRPRVEKLKADHDAIRAEIDRLNESCSMQITANSKDEEEFFRLLTGCMERLQDSVSTSLEKLRAAQEEAELFRANIEECRRLRDHYSGWLTSIKPPLETMIEKLQLSPTENRQLYATFNPAQCDSVRQILNDVAANLEKLDQLLAAGMTGAMQDERETRLRSDTNERFARNQMRGGQ